MLNKFKQCYICKKKFGKVKIHEHYIDCIKLKYKDESGIIVFMNSYSNISNNNYYFYLKIGINSTLKDLDKFIKKEWVECCGHLSCFNDINYKKINMNKKINELYNQNILYTYGTETVVNIFIDSSLNCMSEKDKKIEILVQNEKPFIKCKLCDFDSKYILNNDTLCEKCKDNGIDKYTFGDDIYLINNSPRIGLCDYMITPI
jgi:hypothetical protein